MDLHVRHIDIPLYAVYGYDGNWLFYGPHSRHKYDVTHHRQFRDGGRDIF